MTTLCIFNWPTLGWDLPVTLVMKVSRSPWLPLEYTPCCSSRSAGTGSPSTMPSTRRISNIIRFCTALWKYLNGFMQLICQIQSTGVADKKRYTCKDVWSVFRRKYTLPVDLHVLFYFYWRDNIGNSCVQLKLCLCEYLPPNASYLYLWNNPAGTLVNRMSL